MHTFARCIHLWKATNQRDDANTLTNLKDQNDQMKLSNQHNTTQFQKKIFVLKQQNKPFEDAQLQGTSIPWRN
jgi:hypothetical protein